MSILFTDPTERLVATPTLTDFNLSGPIMFGAVIRPGTFTDTQSIMNFGPENASGRGWYFYLTGGGTLSFNKQGVAGFSAFTLPAANEWYAVVGGYDDSGTDLFAAAYRYSTGTFQNNSANQGTAPNEPQSGDKILIGGTTNSGASFDGEIACAAIYNLGDGLSASLGTAAKPFCALVAARGIVPHADLAGGWFCGFGTTLGTEKDVSGNGAGMVDSGSGSIERGAGSPIGFPFAVQSPALVAAAGITSTIIEIPTGPLR